MNGCLLKGLLGWVDRTKQEVQYMPPCSTSDKIGEECGAQDFHLIFIHVGLAMRPVT